jgi:hypothetical protein
MIIYDKIADKVLFKKLQRIYPGGLDAEHKTLPLRIIAAGIEHYAPAGSQFSQIHPAGSPKGNLHKLPNGSPDNP